MRKQKVMCQYDGDSYVGIFSVNGEGDAEAISVQYNGMTVSARLGSLRPEFVAKTLLGELVRERAMGGGKTRDH